MVPDKKKRKISTFVHVCISDAPINAPINVFPMKGCGVAYYPGELYIFEQLAVLFPIHESQICVENGHLIAHGFF